MGRIPGSSRLPAQNATHRSPWWREDDKDSAAKALIEQFKWLDKEQRHHRDRNLKHLRVYSNRLAEAITGASFAKHDTTRDDHLRRNVGQAVVDAALAQAAANKIRPMPLTIRGNWKLRSRAKKMQQYFDGAFQRLEQHKVWLSVFQAAGIYGTGVEKVYAGIDRVRVERVNTDNIVVDDVEGQDGTTRTIYEYREIDRDTLLEHPELGKHADAIRRSSTLRGAHWGRHRLADPVGVVEAYRLPSYPGAENGRKLIAVEGGSLCDDPWAYDQAPYAVYRWKEPDVGWYGVGLIEEVLPHQLELNQTLQRIQRIAWLTSYGQLWAQAGTIATAPTNEEGQIGLYSGSQPPTHVPINTGLAELYEHADRTYRAAFEDTGISQLMATAKKPAGLDSGAALRTYNETTSARFLHAMQRAELFHCHVAGLMAIAERELERRGADTIPVVAKSRGGLVALRWSDVAIDEDQVQIVTFPTNFLPAEPSGKMQALKEMAEISPELQSQLIRNLDFPDTEAAIARVTAPEDLAELVVSQALDEEEYLAPEPQWPLERMIAAIVTELPRAALDGAPEDRIALLRRWISAAQAILEPPEMAPLAPAALPPPGPEAMAPGPVPAMPPPMAAPMPPPAPMMPPPMAQA